MMEYKELAKIFEAEKLPVDFGFWKSSASTVYSLLVDLEEVDANILDKVRSFRDAFKAGSSFAGINEWGETAIEFARYSRKLIEEDELSRDVRAIFERLDYAIADKFKTPVERLLEYIRDKIEDARLRLDDARDELDYLENSLDAASDKLDELEIALKNAKEKEEEE